MAILKKTIIGYDGSEEMLNDDFILRVGKVELNSDVKRFINIGTDDIGNKIFNIDNHDHLADIKLEGVFNLTFKESHNPNSKKEVLNYNILSFFKEMLCGDGTFGLQYTTKTDSDGNEYAECIGYDPKFIKLKTSDYSQSSVSVINGDDSLGVDIILAHTVSGGVPVKSIGSNVFKDCDLLHGIDLPNTFESFGESCFENCGNLKTLTAEVEHKLIFPSSVKNIYKNAFKNCNLEIVEFTVSTEETYLPDNITADIYAFEENAIKTAKIPGTIIKPIMTTNNGSILNIYVISGDIPANSFGNYGEYGYEFLTASNAITLYLHKDIKSIQSRFSEYDEDSEMEYGMSSIIVKYDGAIDDWCTKINFFDNPLNTTGSSLYLKEKYKNHSTGEIYYSNDYKEITSITCPLSISERAFFGYEKLTEVLIPGYQSTTIGSYAFYKTGITKLTIPSLGSATCILTINDNAFSEISSLNEIVINKNIMNHETGRILDISDSAFNNALNNIVKLKIDINSVNSYKFIPDDDAIIYLIDNPSLKSSITDLEITSNQSDSIKNVYAMFEGYRKLKKILISNYIESLSGGCFKDCPKIEEITSPFIGTMYATKLGTNDEDTSNKYSFDSSMLSIFENKKVSYDGDYYNEDNPYYYVRRGKLNSKGIFEEYEGEYDEEYGVTRYEVALIPKNLKKISITKESRILSRCIL